MFVSRVSFIHCYNVNIFEMGEGVKLSIEYFFNIIL